MILFSDIPQTSFLGSVLRKFLSLIPKGIVVPIMQGPSRGMRWIVGSASHGLWLGSFETEIQRAIKLSLKPGHVFYDVGANVGYYSLLASRYVGSTGCVVAFEPVPRNIEFLSRHAGLNKLSNLRIIPQALADHCGTVNFSLDADPSACSITPDGNLKVVVTTLDKLINEKAAPPPDVIKVDIEGAEIDFLKGAVHSLITHRPVIFMAIHSEEIFATLFKIINEYKLPYTVKDLDGNDASDFECLDEVVLCPLSRDRGLP